MRRSRGGKGKEGGKGTRLAGGGRGLKDGAAVEFAVAVAEAAEKDTPEMKEEKLQRALANMRSKVRFAAWMCLLLVVKHLVCADIHYPPSRGSQRRLLGRVAA